MNKKLVITGMGAITPIGNSVNEYWKNLIAGKSGVEKITHFDASGIPVQVAAEVKNFDPMDYMPKKIVRETDPFMQYAYAATEEALKDSNLTIDSARTGIIMATAMNGVDHVSEIQDELSRGIHSKVSPRFVPKMLGNIAASQIAIAHDIHGPSVTLNTACSSGGDAITFAALMLETNQADVMLAVGAESTICNLVMLGLNGAHALSTRYNDAPETASRPFDIDRDGFVMGEGGGALIIETEEHAKARGAHIYAELAGFANNTDGYHVTSPHPEGLGAIACMETALKNGDMKPEEIGYINMHGTSTKMGDVIETKAIHNVFGDHVSEMPVSSTKSCTGHLMGAGGVTEVIACIKAIETGILPPTINIKNQDTECDLDYIPDQARKQQITAAMSNAFGFGGQNSSIIVRKPQ